MLRSFILKFEVEYFGDWEMIEHISNNDILANTSIKQQELQAIEKKAVVKNPYLKLVDFTDKSDISNEALQLFERDRDIQKFKSLVLDSLDSTETNSEVASMFESSNEYLSDDDLADLLLKDSEFMNMLFEDLE